MVAVSIDELPRQDGFPIGRYRLRYSTVTVTMFDAAIVNGVTIVPITGRTLARLQAAYGSDCTIEPWDEETQELVAKHLEATGKAERAAEVRGEASRARAHPDYSVRPGLHRPETPLPSRAAHEAPATESVSSVEPLIDHDVDHISDLNVLRSMAAALGVDVDERWKQPRLRLEIRRAREGR